MNNCSKIGINNNIYIQQSTASKKIQKIILHFDNKKWQFTR